MKEIIVFFSTVGFAGVSWLMLMLSDWLLGDRPKAGAKRRALRVRQDIATNREITSIQPRGLQT